MKSHRLYPILLVLLCSLAYMPYSARHASAQIGSVVNTLVLDEANRDLDDRIKQLENAANHLTGAAEASVRRIIAELRALQKEFANNLLLVVQGTNAALTDQQMQLFGNVRTSLQQTNELAENLIKLGGTTSSRLIYDTEIGLVHTARELPCREHRPRVFYVVPEIITPSKTELNKVKIRGLYFDLLGARPRVYSGNTELQATVLAGDIDVEIPDQLFTRDKSAYSIPLTVKGLVYEPVRTWFGAVLLGNCMAPPKPAEPITTAIEIRKPLRHEVTAAIWGQHGKKVEYSEEQIFSSLEDYPGTHSCANDAPHRNRPLVAGKKEFCIDKDIGVVLSTSMLQPSSIRIINNCLGESVKVLLIPEKPNCVQATFRMGGWCPNCQVTQSALAFGITLKGEIPPKQLLPQIFKQNVLTSPTSIPFVRSDVGNSYESPTWDYEIRIKVYRGETFTGQEIYLSKHSPSQGFYSTRLDTDTGRVVLNIPKTD